MNTQMTKQTTTQSITNPNKIEFFEFETLPLKLCEYSVILVANDQTFANDVLQLVFWLADCFPNKFLNFRCDYSDSESELSSRCVLCDSLKTFYSDQQIKFSSGLFETINQPSSVIHHSKQSTHLLFDSNYIALKTNFNHKINITSELQENWNLVLTSDIIILSNFKSCVELRDLITKLNPDLNLDVNFESLRDMFNDHFLIINLEKPDSGRICKIDKTDICKKPNLEKLHI